MGLCLAACSSSKDKLSREQQISTRRELGSYYFQVGEIGRAEDQALRGLELDRDDKELRLLLGQVKLRRGDTESLLKAKLVFEGFDIKKEPRAAIGLGQTLERLGLVGRGHRARRSGGAQGQRTGGDQTSPRGGQPALGRGREVLRDRPGVRPGGIARPERAAAHERLDGPL
jgi:hypothetical protein